MSNRIVFFTANWCKACHTVAPLLAGIPHEVVDISPGSKDEYRGFEADIKGLPTIIVYDEQGELYRHTGVFGRSDLKEILDATR